MGLPFAYLFIAISELGPTSNFSRAKRTWKLVLHLRVDAQMHQQMARRRFGENCSTPIDSKGTQPGGGGAEGGTENGAWGWGRGGESLR